MHGLGLKERAVSRNDYASRATTASIRFWITFPELLGTPVIMFFPDSPCKTVR